MFWHYSGLYWNSGRTHRDDKMRFKAIDLTNNEDLKVLLIEDNPREKSSWEERGDLKLLISFSKVKFDHLQFYFHCIRHEFHH